MLLPATAALRIQDVKRFRRDADHALGPEYVGPLIVVRNEVAEDHRPRPAGELEDGHGPVLDTGSPLMLVRLALDVSHHPDALVVGEQVAVHIRLVGAVVWQTVATQALYQVDVANSIAGDQLLGQGVGGKKAALVADGKLDFVSPAGDHHLLGGADAVGHWFFAQNGFGLVGRGGEGPGGMTLVPGTDRNDIGPLSFHHLATVRIVGGGDVELSILFGHGLGTQVGQGNNLVAPRGEVTVDVIGRNASGADDGGA